MKVTALVTWAVTVLAGAGLLAIWLIEYDVGAPGGAASRLPKTVIGGHVLLASSGMLAWLGYVLTGRPVLGWVVLGMLGAVALLGVTMLGRWITVRRALSAAVAGTPRVPRVGMPAESHFPVPLVAAHGLLAVSTLTLVVLTCAGIGG